MSDLITRAQWGARPPKGARNALDPNPKGVAVHWNGPGCAAAIATHDKCPVFLRGIQDFHMRTRGWSDVAYSLFACPHGYLFEGRGKGIGTAANGTNYGNRYYYAIYAMWGQGDGPIPEPMLAAIRRGIALCQSWGAGSQVVPHSAFTATSCPGPELAGMVQSGKLRAASDAPSAPAPAPKPTTSAKPATTTTVKAPRFPLPAGYYFGPRSGPRYSVSGYYSHRANLRRWQQRMRDRGWRLDADGLYGPTTAKVARQFQAEKRLPVADGLIGAQTWAAAWSEPIR